MRKNAVCTTVTRKSEAKYLQLWDNAAERKNLSKIRNFSTCFSHGCLFTLQFRNFLYIFTQRYMFEKCSSIFILGAQRCALSHPLEQLFFQDNVLSHSQVV